MSRRCAAIHWVANVVRLRTCAVGHCRVNSGGVFNFSHFPRVTDAPRGDPEITNFLVNILTLPKSKFLLT